jgi:hypothetical protein
MLDQALMKPAANNNDMMQHPNSSGRPPTSATTTTTGQGHAPSRLGLEKEDNALSKDTETDDSTLPIQRRKIRPPLHATPVSQLWTLTLKSLISVLWVADNAYYSGTVKAILGKNMYNLHYDDEEGDWVDLTVHKK